MEFHSFLYAPTSARPTRARGPSRLLLAALLAASVLITAGLYWSRESQTTTSLLSPAFETFPASKGALVSTIPALGSVALTRQAKLDFGLDGRLVEMNVSVGDAVSAGQQLARLDTHDLEIKVAQAEGTLKISQLKLQQLQAGPRAEEMAAANAAVGAATARYKDASAGPAQAELLAAQTGVEKATAALAAAEARLGQLKQGAAGAEIAAAQAEVARFKSSLASAQAGLEQTKAGPSQAELQAVLGAVDVAKANLGAAEARLADLKAGASSYEVMAAQAEVEKARATVSAASDRVEISKSDKQDQVKYGAGATSVGQSEQALTAAIAAYDAAVERLNYIKAMPRPVDLQAAQSKVDEARASLSAALARAEQMKKTPLASDVSVAQQAMDAAEASLSGAEARLAQLTAGPARAELLAAESAVTSARAEIANAQAKQGALKAQPGTAEVEAARSALASAQAQLAATAGPGATELAMAAQQVTQAEVSLQKAKLDLQHAALVAPFSGIVAAVGPSTGEHVQSFGPVITLVDPAAIRVDATVGEGDVSRIYPGQVATVNVEALGRQDFRGKVIAVAPVATGQEKAVTYLVSVGIDSPGHPVPVGMSAKVNIETTQRENALLVPNSAVRGQGQSQTVQVMVDGTPRERPIKTGASNEQFTEIVSGLDDGEPVVVRTTYAASSR